MRQNPTRAGKYRVFADCYNSSLLAVDNTLKVLDELRLPDETKRIAVLGDVLALGDLSEETHREDRSCSARHRIDLLIGYGIAIRYAIEEATAAGMQAHYYADRAEMGGAVRGCGTTGVTLILFKASHGVNLGASRWTNSSAPTSPKTPPSDTNSSASKSMEFFEFYIFENSASLKPTSVTMLSSVPAFVTATVTDEPHETESRVTFRSRRSGQDRLSRQRGDPRSRGCRKPLRIRDGAFKGSGLESLDAPDSLLSISARLCGLPLNLTTVNLSEATDQLGDAVTENSPQAMIMYR